MRTPAFSDLRDKSIWVTGAAGHLGTPIVCALDKAGAATLCLDLPGKAQTLCERHSLQNAIPESADLCDPETMVDLVESLVKKHGPPDGLVHLAFLSSAGKHLGELGAPDFRRTLDGSLTATFLLCRTLAEKMTAGATQVLFSSMYGMVSPDPSLYRNEMTPNPIDYGVSKAGMLQMMRYFAVHYGPAGLRFNCVTPGAFTNPGVQAAHPDFYESQKQKIPLGRQGSASEIVGPALFLLSETSSYITGHSLVVDGGWTVW